MKFKIISAIKILQYPTKPYLNLTFIIIIKKQSVFHIKSNFFKINLVLFTIALKPKLTKQLQSTS